MAPDLQALVDHSLSKIDIIPILLSRWETQTRVPTTQAQILLMMNHHLEVQRLLHIYMAHKACLNRINKRMSPYYSESDLREYIKAEHNTKNARVAFYREKLRYADHNQECCPCRGCTCLRQGETASINKLSLLQ